MKVNGVQLQSRSTRGAQVYIQQQSNFVPTQQPATNFIGRTSHGSITSFQQNDISPRIKVQTIQTRGSIPLQTYTSAAHLQFNLPADQMQSIPGPSTSSMQREAQVSGQLNYVTGELAVAFLQEELLVRKKQALAQESKSPTYDIRSTVMAKRMQVENQMRAVDGNSFSMNNQIADLRRRIDGQRVKRRYLLSKKTESDSCANQTRHLQSSIWTLREKLKETNIERETYKFSIISSLEKNMREKAEIEAMKAARESQWAIEDNEGSKLAERIDELLRILQIRA